MSLVYPSSDAGRLVRNHDLVLLLAAGLVSQTGDWILATGVAFEVFALTGSTLASAAVLVATQVPQILLSSFAGSAVDRLDRRRVMVVANVLLGLALMPLLLVQRADQIWIVLAVVAVSSCVQPFFLTAEASLLPALVPDDLLVRANAVNGQVRNVARLIGAALGGVAAIGGLGVVATADLATFAVAALLLLLLRHRPAPRGGVAGRRADWRTGFVVARASRPLVAIVVFSALAGLGEGVMGTLFAPFVRHVLGGSAVVYGGILAAQAVGGIVGGAAVTVIGHRFPPRVLLGAGALLFGALDLAMFLLPLAAPVAWPAAVIIALVGLPAAALSVGLATLYQRATGAADRGAVYGAMLTAQNTTMLLGSIGAGAVATALGVLPVIVVQAAAYLAGGVVVLVLVRSSST